MACRIGISTESRSRIDYWKRQEGHTHSRILARNLTYDATQARDMNELGWLPLVRSSSA